ncbi:hypothetical protein [Butyrivibrio fibrisolvens]|uniref:hypothetical protein n=1 Tax=Butyrivibrio fibrisolvens TaxID=831 RepID=UPI0012BCC4DB|nr:hypothetical protein [Butyrivibrio fibrisolvens]
MEIEFEINESMKDWAEKAKAVFDRLQDDESRVLFNLKNRLMTDLIDDNEAWVDEMSKLYSDWNPQGFLNDYKDNPHFPRFFRLKVVFCLLPTSSELGFISVISTISIA